MHFFILITLLGCPKNTNIENTQTNEVTNSELSAEDLTQFDEEPGQEIEFGPILINEPVPSLPDLGEIPSVDELGDEFDDVFLAKAPVLDQETWFSQLNNEGKLVFVLMVRTISMARGFHANYHVYKSHHYELIKHAPNVEPLVWSFTAEQLNYNGCSYFSNRRLMCHSDYLTIIGLIETSIPQDQPIE